MTRRGRYVARRLLFKKQRRLCALCLGPVFLTAPRDAANFATLDHVVPLSKGGADNESNLQLLCRACNGAKGDSEHESWIGSLNRESRAVDAG